MLLSTTQTKLHRHECIKENSVLPACTAQKNCVALALLKIKRLAQMCQNGAKQKRWDDASSDDDAHVHSEKQQHNHVA